MKGLRGCVGFARRVGVLTSHVHGCVGFARRTGVLTPHVHGGRLSGAANRVHAATITTRHKGQENTVQGEQGRSGYGHKESPRPRIPGVVLEYVAQGDLLSFDDVLRFDDEVQGTGGSG